MTACERLEWLEKAVWSYLIGVMSNALCAEMQDNKFHRYVSRSRRPGVWSNMTRVVKHDWSVQI